MLEFNRAAAALGLVASLMTATSAYAIDATSDAIEETASADAKQAIELVSAGVAAKAANDPACPTVTLAPDGESRKLEGAKATLDALARDCANLGAETIVKVGVVGEGVRNKKKSDAAGFDAPMTIQVKDDQGREIETRKINLRVEMAEGVQKVSFRHVEENVSLPPPTANGYANWTIVVGLDPSAPNDEVDETASVDDSADETPVKATRSSRSKRYARSYRSRSARVKAVRYAKTRSGRQQIALQPAPAPVVVSAKPQQGAPGAQVTTTTVNPANGGVMARAAAGFTERRDKAIQDQQVSAAQQRAAAARAQGRAPQPAQPGARSAQARPAVQTAETN